MKNSRRCQESQQRGLEKREIEIVEREQLLLVQQMSYQDWCLEDVKKTTGEKPANSKVFYMLVGFALAVSSVLAMVVYGSHQLSFCESGPPGISSDSVL